MEDGRVTRRLLLAGAGALALSGLSACGLGSTEATSTPVPRAPARPPTPGASGTAGASAPRGTAGALPDEAALRRRIASLLVVGFRGTEVAAGDWILTAIRNGLGGVVLFDRELHTDAPRNITSPAQVTKLVKALRAASPGRLIVSIDQEGGQTSRLNPDDGFPATKSEAEIGAANSKTTTQNWARGMARSLSSIGVNLNYAPVVDLNVNPNNPAIGKLGRSFSANPDVVVNNATIEVQAHRDAGVRTVLKHFPGLGSATANTDFNVADVSGTWHRDELQPYQKMIKAGHVDSIMAAHVVNTQLDPSGRPASLSRPIVTDLLRGQLGWKGPVVSDDMQAAAITNKFNPQQAATLALQAGVDLLVFANQQVFDANVVDETVDTVVSLVRSGDLPRSQIDQAAARVDALRPPKTK